MSLPVLRGGSELSPATFQLGGLFVQGGRRSGSKRSGSKRSGSRNKNKRKGSRKLRGGQSCSGASAATVGGESFVVTPPLSALTGGSRRRSRSLSRSLSKPLVLPRYRYRYEGGGSRKLRKRSGKTRRHRTKSYSA